MIMNECCPKCDSTSLDITQELCEWIDGDTYVVWNKYTCDECGHDFVGRSIYNIKSRIIADTDDDVEGIAAYYKHHGMEDE